MANGQLDFAEYAKFTVTIKDNAVNACSYTFDITEASGQLSYIAANTQHFYFITCGYIVEEGTLSLHSPYQTTVYNSGTPIESTIPSIVSIYGTSKNNSVSAGA